MWIKSGLWGCNWWVDVLRLSHVYACVYACMFKLWQTEQKLMHKAMLMGQQSVGRCVSFARLCVRAYVVLGWGAHD